MPVLSRKLLTLDHKGPRTVWPGCQFRLRTAKVNGRIEEATSAKLDIPGGFDLRKRLI